MKLPRSARLRGGCLVPLCPSAKPLPALFSSRNSPKRTFPLGAYQIGLSSSGSRWRRQWSEMNIGIVHISNSFSPEAYLQIFPFCSKFHEVRVLFPTFFSRSIIWLCCSAVVQQWSPHFCPILPHIGNPPLLVDKIFKKIPIHQSKNIYNPITYPPSIHRRILSPSTQEKTWFLCFEGRSKRDRNIKSDM